MDRVVFWFSSCEIYWFQDIFSMGGACSRKRDHRDDEDDFHLGVSRRYCKSGSSKWLTTSFTRPVLDIQPGRGKGPSLMDLCIRKICEVLTSLNLFWARDWGSVFLGLRQWFLLINRTLINITRSLCSQEILVNRSSMSWCTPDA